MLVNIKVTGGLNIELGQIDPKATGGLRDGDVGCSVSSSCKCFNVSNT